MIKLFKAWHWLHTWSQWTRNPVEYVRYVWTNPGHYAHTRQTQERTCSVCGKVEVEVVMGYNTTVVIYNDSLHDIESDPEFGKRLVTAILEQHGKDSVTVIAKGAKGSSTAAAVVVEQHHADETSLVAVGGNTAAVVHTQLGGSFLHKEGQDTILKNALLSEWRKKQ